MALAQGSFGGRCLCRRPLAPPFRSRLCPGHAIAAPPQLPHIIGARGRHAPLRADPCPCAPWAGIADARRGRAGAAACPQRQRQGRHGGKEKERQKKGRGTEDETTRLHERSRHWHGVCEEGRGGGMRRGYGQPAVHVLSHPHADDAAAGWADALPCADPVHVQRAGHDQRNPGPADRDAGGVRPAAPALVRPRPGSTGRRIRRLRGGPCRPPPAPPRGACPCRQIRKTRAPAAALSSAIRRRPPSGTAGRSAARRPPACL